jgi:hypothetical protein
MAKRIRLRLAVASSDKGSRDGNDLLRIANTKEIPRLRYAPLGKYPIGRVKDFAVGQL